MAGIGFELRRLFRKEGLLNNLRAYAYSSMTTVGAMILCTTLILVIQKLMGVFNGSYADWELYIATVSYVFIFSIVLTSGISIVITRYLSDCIYTKEYAKLMSSYVGALSIMIPFSSLVAIIFLFNVEGTLAYKIGAYLFFLFMVIIWIQNIYLSALKDYIRIFRSFLIGAIVAIGTSWLLMSVIKVPIIAAAFFGIDIGLFMICLLTTIHFQQTFPILNNKKYFEFLNYFKKIPLLFINGCLVYSGIYLHNFIYWFGEGGQVIGDVFHVNMFYDVPAFFAFISVLPTLVMFVVSLETSFFEKYKMYYLQILNGGTIRSIQQSKSEMSKTLMKEVGFLMEIQLVFTVISIGLGILLFPRIGFTMQQLDLFIILALGYYLFIIYFSFVHILMYFDDQKGIVFTSLIFFVLNIGLTFITKGLGFDGLGMFIAAFISLVIIIFRLLYVLKNINYFTFCSQPIYVKNNKKVIKRDKSNYSKTTTIVMTIVLGLLLLTACSNTSVDSAGQKIETQLTATSLPINNSIDYSLPDDKRLYNRDNDSDIKSLYITIFPQDIADNDLDWYEFNHQQIKEEAVGIKVLLQEGLPNGGGTESGYFQYNATQTNAKMFIRGNTAWNSKQKSYRIKINDEAGLLMDQQTLNLNKHQKDITRLRNKLSYDLMEPIPNMVSLRTHFMELYVKDLSADAANSDYESYGLFTHVEHPNKKFLKSHMLDPNGYLYKGRHFEFLQYPEIVSTTDPNYDKKKFERFLEIKGREEHEKLIEMVKDINNLSIPIQETVEKHFDLDNLMTFLAINILMDNMDTDAHNFFLYSPLNLEKWYFIPWDYDGGWELLRRTNNLREYQGGISTYWGIPMYNRLFRHQEYVDMLSEKIEYLYNNYINEDIVKAQIAKYENIVYPRLMQMPDLYYLPEKITEYDKDIQLIIDTPKRGKERYYEDLEKPKPFFLNEVIQNETSLDFSWGNSFDLQSDNLVYEFTLAKDYYFKDIVVEDLNVPFNDFSVTDKLEPGIYYWKVYARDSKGNRQSNFEQFFTEDGVHISSIKEIEVK